MKNETQLLSTIAMMMARSTAVTGYRGAGRLFRPLNSVKRLKRTDGTVSLNGGARITFPAFDPYWAPYLWTSKPYEPDVEAVFRSLRHVPNKIFVDCGANIGFWTLKMFDARYRFTSFVAVEANRYVFEYLQRNVAANGIPAVLHFAAIAERSGETVHLECSAGHAVGAVSEQGTPVKTVSLNSILEGFAVAGSDARPVAVVKLDVEGSEIAGIRGAKGLEGIDVIFVYEDWPRSGLPVSKFLLSERYSIFGVHPDGRVAALETMTDVINFNRDSFPGYHASNLIASRARHLEPVRS